MNIGIIKNIIPYPYINFLVKFPPASLVPVHVSISFKEVWVETRNRSPIIIVDKTKYLTNIFELNGRKMAIGITIKEENINLKFRSIEMGKPGYSTLMFTP